MGANLVLESDLFIFYSVWSSYICNMRLMKSYVLCKNIIVCFCLLPGINRFEAIKKVTIKAIGTKVTFESFKKTITNYVVHNLHF